MKAVVIHEHGGVGCLNVEDVQEPQMATDEVVVEIRAAALNHLDIWVRNGRPGLDLHMPHILGSDAAGVVVATGSSVRSIEVGNQVVLNPGLSCGICEYCLRGEQSECLTFGLVGMNCPGTFAERISVPAKNVHPVPAHLSDEEAAALPLSHLTAWRMLMTRAQLRSGETVLIHGIGGGVAFAGLQLAKVAGAHVIVTSSSDEKLRRARIFGADHGINYSTNSSVGEAVKDLTGGRGVDVILDAVGAATWPINFKAARRGGRIVHCGVTTGQSAEVDISALYWNHLSVMGTTLGSSEEFRLMLEAASVTKLRPVIDTVLPMSRVRQATERMELGEQFGKIVLMPGGVDDDIDMDRMLAEPFAEEVRQTIEMS